MTSMLRYTILWLTCLILSPMCSADDASQRIAGDIKPLLQQFCMDCHDASTAEGDFEMELPGGIETMRSNRDVWLRTLRQITVGVMPPPDAEQPSDEERSRLASAIDHCINSVDCSQRINPGHVTIRRLNRSGDPCGVLETAGLEALGDDAFMEFTAPDATSE